MERFFILGCQRSGTTLLRLILESHPDVACYDEMKSYAVLRGAEESPGKSARLLGFKLPRWTEQLLEPVLIDEGEESCPNFYRGEKILFLHRDPRDTVASMHKLKAGASNWCELWVPRILEAKLARDESFRKRYAAKLAMAGGCPSRLIGLAALYWRYKNDAFFDYRDQGMPVLPISYEELVTRPEPVLRSVCGHLGVPFHTDLLRHNELAHGELFANGMTVGNTDPKKPIRSDSVDQWRALLSSDEIECIDRIAGQLSF